MIRLGLCSGACITRDIKNVLAVASAARLDAIEWAADVHVGAEGSRAAEEAMMATLQAGLTTASYATLYRAGSEDGDFSRFDALLKIASLMQAPIMRLFACGNGGPPDKGPAGEAELPASLVSAFARLGDRAAERGITLCLSMSRGTFLDRYDRAARLIAAVDHDFVRLAWEDLPNASAAEATAALKVAGRYAGVVVAKCAGKDGSPNAIAAGSEAWRERIQAYRRFEQDPKMSSFVLLGAARGEGAEGQDSLASDAKALRDLIAEPSSTSPSPRA